MLFRTKICGVTNGEDAKMVADAGVDAVGLNFYGKSKRFVDTATAVEIVKHLPETVKRVGVFVNASFDAIHKIADAVALDYVQLHGDEPPEFLDQIKTPVIRAFRCMDGLAPVAEYLATCKRKPVAVLVDAYDPDEYGGTGKSLHWPDLRGTAKYIGDLPLIVAGGLTPSNVARAILDARPFGVDTASGVERDDPRRKQAKLSKDFVTTAKSAFDALAFLD